VLVSCADVDVIATVPELVEVDWFSLSSCSNSSWSSFESSAKSFSRPVEVVDEVVGELRADSVLDGSEVIWARPTPAAAAKASATITPTRERRLNLLNRFCTLNPFDLRGFGV
jgi:hypothetical protein